MLKMYEILVFKIAIQKNYKKLTITVIEKK